MSKLFQYLSGVTAVSVKYNNLEKRIKRLEDIIFDGTEDRMRFDPTSTSKGSHVETLPEGKELTVSDIYTAAKFPDAYPSVEPPTVTKLGES